MRKILGRLCSLAIAILIVCLTLTTVAAYFSLSEQPNKQNSNFNFGAIKSVSILVSKLNLESASLFAPTTSTTTARSIKLTKDELNAALELYTSGTTVASLFEANKDKQYDKLKFEYGSFNNGEFTISLIQKIRYKIPFGSYLNFTIKTVPEIKNQRLSIKVNSFKVGRLTIPVSILNILLKLKEDEMNNLEEVKTLVNAVTDLKVNKDDISIVYSPDRFSKFLSSDFIHSLK